VQGWLNVATLSCTKGKNGRLQASCAPGLPFLLEAGQAVAVVPPPLDLPRMLTVSGIDASNESKVQLDFKEITNITDAEAYAGCHLLVHASNIDANFTQSASVLTSTNNVEGVTGAFTVIDVQAGHIGTLDFIEERPMQSLLHITGSAGQEILVPLVDEFIEEFSEDTKTIRLNLPPGLLEL
jgi:16S rRNA processing protein RimM